MNQNLCGAPKDAPKDASTPAPKPETRIGSRRITRGSNGVDARYVVKPSLRQEVLTVHARSMAD
eukprot:526496-Amphidinium_carterae.1